ncbi:XdhC/CoxI family protein [Segetibacter sp. 3557_3]|uniref:XdhC family protein n=1 Tax=Segetibacter sp. 3557_3 TaxID=2547429 RepID=UPI001058A427|nr:XdhC/CoxI family protein [Segetibacter sp. 3557_3]TDH24227.1 XdhC/CoxI family protein [Segetibacter sp. 3557_3]
MKEIEDIVAAYQKAQSSGLRSALATVVHVEGSSYRRPGARMLVTDDGRLTGAISGGCLEGDALRKALLAISEQQNKLVTYDTTDEDDARFGVQLGCNGIVHILFEPIDNARPNNPIALLEKITQHRHEATLLTLFSLKRSLQLQPGTVLLYQDENFINGHPHETGNALLRPMVLQVVEQRKSLITDIVYTGESFTGLFDFIQPPISLVIFGAGNDAIPVVTAANIPGWHTTIIDGRASHATTARFPHAKKVVVAKASDALTNIHIDNRTAFVLMTHNFNYDRDILQGLLKSGCRYIGMLGPLKKLERMLAELGIDEPADKFSLANGIYGPIGLDIGAETAEEIALSIVAEVMAVFEDGKGKFLREKRTAIHERNTEPIAGQPFK